MIRHKQNKIILAGDFNLPNIDWDRLNTGNAYNKHINIVFNTMLRYNLKQVVCEPTRVQGTCSSILDLVFLSQDFSECFVCVEEGLSDHRLVSISLPVVQMAQSYSSVLSYKDYSHADDVSIIEHMENCLVDCTMTDACSLWNRFKVMCHYCINRFIPTKNKKVRKHTPWMTRDVIHIKRKVKRLKKKHGNPLKIKEAQNSLEQKVIAAKNYYYNTSLPNFIKNDPTKFWNHMKEKKEADFTDNN